MLDLSNSSAYFHFHAGNVRCVGLARKATLAATSSGWPKRFISQTTASAASTITLTTDSGAEASGEWSVSRE